MGVQSHDADAPAAVGVPLSNVAGFNAAAVTEWAVGATSMGPWGGEVLGMLALAIHAEVPTDQLRHMIYAYPTFHRGIEAAVGDLHPLDR